MGGGGDAEGFFMLQFPSNVSWKRAPFSQNLVHREPGGSGLELCKELQQMTLLVDVDTDFQDVQKAHLTFQRTENETEEMGPGTRWGEESWISDCD